MEDTAQILAAAQGIIGSVLGTIHSGERIKATYSAAVQMCCTLLADSSRFPSTDDLRMVARLAVTLIDEVAAIHEARALASIPPPPPDPAAAITEEEIERLHRETM